ncbi:MAG: ribbon-helix-helix protein, CopG family [Dehalococcoidia bacterium]|nr:ribbon-helix-helix protein, CopG family [Dehalococcoidia bacterium]
MVITETRPAIVRITVSLPANLLARVDALVARGGAASRTALIIEALAADLARRYEEEIDRKFYELANDPDLAAEERELHAAFAGADRETWSALKETDGGWDG